MSNVTAKEVDVIVAGGGPSGLIAATAAARLGVKTLLVEREGFLGGNATAGLVAQFFGFFNGDRQVVRGIPEEFTERIKKSGGSTGFEPYLLLEASIKGTPHTDRGFPFNPEIVKIVADELVTEAGVHTLFHTQVVGALMEGQQVMGLAAEGVGGRREFHGKIIIDATGDAVAAKRAGAAVMGEDEGLRKERAPVTLIFRVTDIDLPRLRALPREEKQRIVQEGLAKGEILWESLGFFRDPMSRDAYCLMSRISGLDVLDDEEFSEAERIGRQQVKQILQFLRQRVPGCECCKLAAIATRIGIRQTRRVVGRYRLTEEDIYESRTFEDGIALGQGVIHVHDHAGTGVFAKVMDEPFQIPVRCLLPVSVEGLVVTGRAISSTRVANGGILAMGVAMALGQAAGTLAACAVKNGVLPSALQVDEVQRVLRAQGTLVSKEDIY